MLGSIVLIIGFLVEPITQMEHYNRVYKNPVTVQATVIKHDDYDDDGDTDYRSYIFYRVGDTMYANIRYEDKDKQSDLTPIGQTVEVQVSPEDPTKLISSLVSDGQLLVVTIPLFSIMMSLVLHILIIRKRSNKLPGTPDRETIVQDILMTIRGRMFRFFWILVSVGYLLLCWRYPSQFQHKTMIAASLCGAAWLWCVCRDMRDSRIAKRQEFDIRRDTLVQKEYIPDSEGDTYKLHFRSGDKYWDTNVSKRYFDSMSEGSTVLAVYMPGKKKPMLHYNVFGDAV